jgi:hypothetical protein
MNKILRYVDPASIIMFVLGIPFLILFGYILQNMQPLSLYYSLLSGVVAGLPLCIPFLILVVAFWVFLRIANKFLAQRQRPLRIGGRVALVIGVLLADVLSLAMGFSIPRRFDVGHAYCDMSPLAVETLRCEGEDWGFLQDRISAVARLGVAAEDIAEKIETYPDFSLFQTACADLPGGFGDTCYTGRFERKTGDTNFMNVYLAKDKVLVLETENIVINGSKENAPIFIPGDELKLEKFVDLERFRKDMTE